MRLKTLYDKHKGICYFCGHRVTFGCRSAAASKATREHKHPKVFGGGNGDNLVLACSRCNQLKGEMLISIEIFSRIAKNLPEPTSYLSGKERFNFLAWVAKETEQLSTDN